jgi:hypothetical protein
MARIENTYIVWWETVTKIIQWDYTQSLKGVSIDFATMTEDDGTGNMVPCVSHFAAETVEEIDAKVLEIGLLDSNYVVTPH